MYDGKQEWNQDQWESTPDPAEPRGGSIYKSHRNELHSRGWTIMVGMAEPYLYERSHLGEVDRNGKLWNHTLADL